MSQMPTPEQGELISSVEGTRLPAGEAARSAMTPAVFLGGEDVTEGHQGVLHQQLALFLLLFTFFVVMTARADFDISRTGAILGSLQTVFGGTQSFVAMVDPGTAAGSAFDRDRVLPIDPALAQEMAPVLEEALALAPQLDSRSESALVLPTGALYIGESAGMMPRADSFVSSLAGVLAVKQVQRRQLVLSVQGKTSEVAIARARSLTRALVQAGAPVEAIVSEASAVRGDIVSMSVFRLAGGEA